MPNEFHYCQLGEESCVNPMMYGLMDYYKLELKFDKSSLNCTAWEELSRTSNPASGVLVDKVLEEAQQLAIVQAACKAVDITKKADNQVFLEGGRVLTSGLLARLAGSAKSLVLIICTLGDAIDRRVDEYSRNGMSAHAYFLDVVGTCLIEAAGRQLVKLIEKQVHDAGYETTIPLGPGHSYWNNLLDQRVIYELLNPEKLGISILDSGIMLPKKSISMVIGVGQDLPPSKENHCHYCSMGNDCPLSRARNTC